MSSDRLETLQKLPSLKGPALSIVMALLIAQRPLQSSELETFTGYADQAVRRGLRKLRHMQAIVHLSRSRGWALTPQWQQLTLPLTSENHELDREKRSRSRENHELDPPIVVSSSNSINQMESTTTTKTTRQGSDRENHDLPHNHQGEITPKPPAEITARSGSPEITAVARWLQKAGINPDSGVWAEITSQALDPNYVKSHVLELLAAEAGIAGADEKLQTGGLIYRLRHQWRAPPMRCEECLRVERECRCGGGYRQRIPEELKDVITR
jgi:hypothetical protein